MKSILISIKSKHVLDILNGDKTLELRKSVPKDFKGWVYVYCTKAKPLIIHEYYTDEIPCYEYSGSKLMEKYHAFANGKVVARFWFDEYDFIEFAPLYGYYSDIDDYRYAVNDNELKDLCLSYNDLHNYGKDNDLYAWHIKKLEAFDKPMELSEMLKVNPDVENIGAYGWAYTKEELPDYIPLTKAPQSYQFVYVKEKVNE